MWGEIYIPFKGDSFCMMVEGFPTYINHHLTPRVHFCMLQLRWRVCIVQNCTRHGQLTHGFARTIFCR